MVPGVARLRAIAPRPALVAVGVANAVPMAGIGVLGWDAAALVLLYWLELGIMCLFAVVRAIFAGRPSEFDGDPLIVGALERRRASLSIPGTGLGVQLSTLPVLVAAVPMLAMVWLFAGAVTVGVLGEPPDPGALETVILGALGILVGEGAQTLREYFYGGEYREHSAQTAIQGVFVRGAAIALGGLFTVTMIGLASDSVATDEPIAALEPGVVGAPLLLGLVVVKFGFDLAGVYRDRLVAFDESTNVLFGWAYEPPTDEPVDGSLASNASRIRPALWGRLLGGLARVRRRPGAALVGVPVLLVALLFATGRAWTIAGALALGAVLVPGALLQADYWLRYGAVEYRTDGDAVVASDRLFRTTLWRVEPWDETGLRIERDWLDERLGTRTLVIELGDDEELRLARLPDVAPVLEAFDRRPDRPKE
ncbi:DUF6498-containing protein [Halorussus marinus]|uniref:DUF6498-containing protein n=1 Tax=Halorussus marinus TaxID=2505976 RepID=UPI0010921567|nr:DUF6498-containing protein [Halorussus marinus]